MLSKKLNLVFRGTNFIKLAFDQVLKELFADANVVDEQFRYSENDEETKIKIYRSFPQRLELFPCISITAEAFDGSLTGMGIEGEEVSEQKDESGMFLQNLTYTGQQLMPINLKVFAIQSIDDREQLTDTLYVLLRILGGRQAFAPFGFAYTGIHVNGEDQFMTDDQRMVFTNSITVQCFTDYTYVVDVATQQLIDRIVVKLYGQMKSTDTPYPLYTES